MQEYDRYDAAYYDFLSRRMPGDVEFYLEEIRRAGSPVLELGCGTGRLLEFIAREGFNVVGLDRAPSMLKIARAKVAMLPPDVSALIEIVDGDMRAPL